MLRTGELNTTRIILLAMTNQTVTQNQVNQTTVPEGRYKHVLATIGVFLLGGFMALSGMMKLAGSATDMLVGLGVPAWAVPVIGGLELAGAIGLAIPRLRSFAALGLVAILVGAVVTHLANADFVGWTIPFVLAVLFALVAWKTRPDSLRSA